MISKAYLLIDASNIVKNERYSMKINRTTQRTIDILKLVSKASEGVTLDEICEKLEIPKTSAYDIVTTLVTMNMINVSKDQKIRYSIGLTAYRIGISYTNNLNSVEMMEPVLKAFAKEVGKTVFFGVPTGHEIVYLCKYEPENPVITTATVGVKNPMYCTSLGKAMLAFMDEDTIEAVIKRTKFRRRTDYTIITGDDLRDNLATIRECGYAMDYRELEEHMVCIGAPVYDSTGEVTGAISISGLYRPDEDYERQGELVKQKAEEVSKLLGFVY